MINETKYNQLKESIKKKITAFNKNSLDYGPIALNKTNFIGDIAAEIMNAIHNHIQYADPKNNQIPPTVNEHNTQTEALHKELAEKLSRDGIIDEHQYKLITGFTISNYKEMNENLGSDETLKHVMHFAAMHEYGSEGRKKLRDIGFYEEPSDNDNLLFHKFLEYSIGNQELNKKLDTLLQSQSKLGQALYTYPIKQFRTISHKSRHLDYLNEHREKLDTLAEMPTENVKYEYRLSLDEYKKLTDSIDVNELICEMHKQIYDTREYNINTKEHDTPEISKEHDSTKLAAIQKMTELANMIVKHAKSRCSDFQRTTLIAGDVIVHDIKSVMELENRQANREENAMLLGNAVYGHAALVTTDKNNKNIKLSHVVAGYIKEDIPPEELLFSDIFRINVGKLLTPAAIAAAIQEESSNLEPLSETEREVVLNRALFVTNSLYKEIYQGLNTKRFENIVNSTEKRQRAGMHDLANKVADKLGARQAIIQEQSKLNEIYDIFFNQAENIEEKMICSEFVAKTTAACLVELNKRLQEEYRSQAEMLNIPFTESDLDNITPDQLIKVLKEHHCVERLADYGIQSGLFKRPAKVLATIASGMAQKFKDDLSENLDTDAICTNLLDTFLEKHNEQFPNYIAQLTKDQKKGLIENIKQSVEGTIQKIEAIQAEGTEATRDHGKTQGLIASIITGTVTVICNTLKKLVLSKADQVIYDDMKDIAGKVMDHLENLDLEKPSSWLHKVSNKQSKAAQHSAL